MVIGSMGYESPPTYNWFVFLGVSSPIDPRGNHSRKYFSNGLVQPPSFHGNTVDGSEIQRSPVEEKVVHPIICQVLAPSPVVVWDLFHQQY